MRQWFAILFLALSAPSFANDATPAQPAQLAVTGDAAGAAAVVRGQPLTFTVKRYVSPATEDDAYVRLDDGLRALARERGVQVGEGSAGTLTVEVDSTFYVYTNRFTHAWSGCPSTPRPSWTERRTPTSLEPNRSPTWCA
jgi:hypothetical protein